MQQSIPLEVSHLVKKYRQLTAVRDVSFSTHTGEIFGLLGPNGAGKTSIINVITTLEKPTSGTVKVFGRNVVEESHITKAQIGIVHQEIIHSGFFTVDEILQFQSGYYGRRKNKERIEYVLEKLSLVPHRSKKVKQLSGGMKRRLMIAKALVHEPKVLLLDEPTAGVDFELRETLWDFVLELKKQGLSILLTTHYLEEAEVLCDRVGIINLGQLEAIGPTQEVIKKFTQRKVYLELKEEKEIKSPYLSAKDGNEYEFSLPADKSFGDLLVELQMDASMIKDIRIVEGGLEEALRSVLHKDETREDKVL